MVFPTSWSELPFDLLKSIFHQLTFVDFQRAKIVCPNWYLASKSMKKKESPWLMLFPENNNCVLYNPELNKIYKTLTDYSQFRFLANSGKWFLVITPQHNLRIIDLFTSETIYLPPLESLLLRHNRRQIEDKELQFGLYTDDVDVLSDCGLLWVDEKNKGKYVVVVWYLYSFESRGPCNIAYCKNGYDKYVNIPIDEEDLKGFRYPRPHMLLLRGYKLYHHIIQSRVRILDLSGKTFEDVSETKRSSLHHGLRYPTRHLAVTLSGEVLLVCGLYNFLQRYPNKIVEFKAYKEDYYGRCESRLAIEVESFRSDDDDEEGEALLMDLGGVTISVKDVPGIEPNSVYFSGHKRYRDLEFTVDICVFNLATKTLKRFTNPLDVSLAYARWIIPTLA